MPKHTGRGDNMNEKEISGKLLAGAQAAESSLARSQYDELEAALPEGHPLQEQVEKYKAELGGDLSGLPENHPLILQMKAAKERYDADIAEETEEAQDKAKEVKKAKKLDREKARKDRLAQEDEQDRLRKGAATEVNQQIDNVLDSIRGMYKVLADHEENLNIHPISRARCLRLKRMLVAVERGLSESRMSKV